MCFCFLYRGPRGVQAGGGGPTNREINLAPPGRGALWGCWPCDQFFPHGVWPRPHPHGRNAIPQWRGRPLQMLAEVLAACRRLGLLEEGVHFADSLHEMPGVGAHLQYTFNMIALRCLFLVAARLGAWRSALAQIVLRTLGSGPRGARLCFAARHRALGEKKYKGFFVICNVW